MTSDTSDNQDKNRKSMSSESKELRTRNESTRHEGEEVHPAIHPEHFRLALDAAELGTWHHNLQQGDIFFDSRLCEIYGVENQGLTREMVASRIHPEDVELVNQRRAQMIDPDNDLNIFHETYRILTPQEEIRWIEAHGRMRFGVINGTRQAVDSFGIVADVTQRKVAEDTLKESEKRYRTLFDSIDEGFALCELVFDKQGEPIDYRIVEVNPAFERILNATAEQVIGVQVMEHLQDAGDAWLTPAVRAAMHGESSRFETFRKHSQRWISAYMFPQSENRFAILFTDITEHKRQEKALKKTNEELEERVRSRTKQLRTLASRLTMAEQIERRRISQILHDDLQQLLYSIEMQLELIRGLSFATGSDQLATQTREVSRWLGDAIRLTRQLTVDLSPPVLNGKGLTEALRWLERQMSELHNMTIQIEEEKPVQIHNQQMRLLLFQIIRELLFNVVKHSGIRSAEIRISERKEEQIAQIRVIDEGKGFDPEERSHEEESGFGLYSISERLSLFGGRMEVRSAPQKGTEVIIEIPNEEQ